MGDNDRVTRLKEQEENIIQKVVERVLANKGFLNKLLESVNNALHENQKKIKTVEEKVHRIESQVRQIDDSVELQEQYSRSNNLRFFGIPETENENTNEVIMDVCKKKLNIPLSPEDIDICHRLSRGEGATDHHRPIMVRFVRRSLRNNVFKAKKNLKGAKIIIREDLTKRRVSIVKDLIKRTNQRDVFSNNGNIFIKIKGKILKIHLVSEYDNILKTYFA